MQQRKETMGETLSVFLRTVSLFSELNEADVDLLAQVATEVDYPRNGLVVRQGDPGGSLLIVRTGEVEVALERPSGESVPLSTFRPGDFFGEMSLFDRRPRSATATAVVDSRIVEIRGEAFMGAITKTPQVALRVLAEIASRIRRTDETVRELADRVYREAYPAVQASVATELDSIKTIYQKTEERAAQTLERAGKTVDNMEKLWSLMLRTIPVVALALVILTFFGVRSFNDVKAKVDQVNTWHHQIQAEAGEIESTSRKLKIVEETMTELRGIRESAGLGRAIETPDDLRRVALNYRGSQREVYQRYIEALGASDGDDFEPEVVLEAVDTYVALGRGARDDGRLTMPSKQGGKVLDALVYVAKNLAGPDDAAHPGRTDWREYRRLRELFLIVGKAASERQRNKAVDDLKTAIATSGNDRTRENMALILADFGQKDETASDILKKMADDGSRRGWKSALGALGLAKLGDRAGWEHITRQLEEGKRSYAVAALLAQQDHSELERLVEQFGQTTGMDRLTASIKKAINGRIRCRTGSWACDPFDNCFEERYARWLVMCLDSHCDSAQTTAAIDGECSLGSQH
jgi:CRP/FNR family cyclic AMP-dependent transcriptional regulator